MIADLPDWVDVQFLRDAAGTIVVAALLLALVMLFVIRSIVAKVIVVMLLAATIIGVVQYRSTLGDCGTDGCGCVLFGEPVHNENCPQT